MSQDKVDYAQTPTTTTTNPGHGGISICKAVHPNEELKLDLSGLPGVIRVQIKTRSTLTGVPNTL